MIKLHELYSKVCYMWNFASKGYFNISPLLKIGLKIGSAVTEFYFFVWDRLKKKHLVYFFFLNQNTLESSEMRKNEVFKFIHKS